MDLNYLLSRHQISLMKSDAADSIEARVAHESLARGYAMSIDSLRDARRPRGMLPRKLAGNKVLRSASA